MHSPGGVVSLSLVAVVACGQASPGTTPGAADAGRDATVSVAPDAATSVDAGEDAAALDSGIAPTDAGDAGAPFVPAAHRSFPSLVKNSGRLLSPMKLVTIVASNDLLSTELLAFSDALVAGAWWQAVGAPYALGSATSVHATGPAITANPTPGDMTSYIASLVSSGGAPAPDGETCYLLYLPDGISIASGPGFTAYHSPYPAEGQGLGDGWAVVSRAQPYGGGETQLGELTRVASHEVLEAATDPGWDSYAVAPAATPVWSGSVWSVYQVPGPVEAGDLCEGTRAFEGADGGLEYQRVLGPTPSPNDDPCLPPHAEPYYDVSAPNDWYALGADGGATTIPITGWSAAKTDDWLVIAVLAQATSGFAPLQGTLLDVVSPLPGVGSCAGVGMNDGVAASLTLSSPAGAKSGDYAVVLFESFRVDASTCWPVLGGDQFHLWLAGVYVP